MCCAARHLLRRRSSAERFRFARQERSRAVAVRLPSKELSVLGAAAAELVAGEAEPEPELEPEYWICFPSASSSRSRPLQ